MMRITKRTRRITRPLRQTLAAALCLFGMSLTTLAAAAESPMSGGSLLLIEAYGDSTTSGWQVINGRGANTPNSAPVELERILRAQYRLPVKVVNEGVGATELSQLVEGTDHRHPLWREQMARSQAVIVTLNFALNDAYYAGVPTPGIKPETPNIYAEYLRIAIAQARAAGKIVVLNEPNPTCEPVRARTLSKYVEALRRVAVAEHVPLVSTYDYLLKREDWQALLTDCLHPSDALYKIKAKREASVLARLIEQRRLSRSASRPND